MQKKMEFRSGDSDYSAGFACTVSGISDYPAFPGGAVSAAGVLLPE